MELKKEYLDLVIIVAAVIFLLIQGYLIYRMFRAKRKAKLDVKEWLKTSEEVTDVEEPWSGLHVGTGIYDGKEYRYAYNPASKYSPPGFSITMDAVSAGSFEIRLENRADRFFKNLGFASEIQTHDPDFDGEFYIQTEAPEFATFYLMDVKKRNAIRDFFTIGFTSVRHDGNVVAADWIPFTVMGEMDSHTIAKSAGLLAELSKNMPDLAHVRTEALPAWKLKKTAAFVVPILLLISGYVLFFFGKGVYPVLEMEEIVFDSLKYSLPAMAFFIWAAVLLLRGRSSSHTELLIVAAISLPAFPLFGAGMEITLNGLLDESKPAAHVVLVVEKNAVQSQTEVKYYATVESWREQKKTEQFYVDQDFFREAVPGKSMVRVHTKEGWCGFEWVVFSEIVKM